MPPARGISNIWESKDEMFIVLLDTEKGRNFPGASLKWQAFSCE